MALRTPIHRAYVAATLLRIWLAAKRSRAPEPVTEIPIDQGGEGQGARWQPVVQALSQALPKVHGGTRADLDIVVGDEFVRYALVPSPQVRLSGAELTALAENVMRRTYGEAVRGWEMRLTSAGRNRLLAAGLDPLLVQALRDVGVRNGRLRCLVPAFVDAVAKLRPSRRQRAWVLNLEPASAVLALFDATDLVALRVRRAPIASAHELSEMLDRESRRAGSDVRDLVLLGGSAGTLQLPAGWSLRGAVASAQGSKPLAAMAGR